MDKAPDQLRPAAGAQLDRLRRQNRVGETLWAFVVPQGRGATLVPVALLLTSYGAEDSVELLPLDRRLRPLAVAFIALSRDITDAPKPLVDELQLEVHLAQPLGVADTDAVEPALHVHPLLAVPHDQSDLIAFRKNVSK